MSDMLQLVEKIIEVSLKSTELPIKPHDKLKHIGHSAKRFIDLLNAFPTARAMSGFRRPAHQGFRTLSSSIHSCRQRVR